MAWAGLIPIAYDMLRPKPGAPTINLPARPDRSAYINQILNNGFNPNNDLYKLAQESTMAKINQELAARGIMGSAATQAQSGTMAHLANNYVQNELNRQIAAMTMANNYDSGVMNDQMGVARMRSDQDWRSAGLDEQRGQAMVRNLGGLVDTYQRYNDKKDMNSRLDRWEAESNRRHDDMMRNYGQGTPAASGGTYYGAPSYYAPGGFNPYSTYQSMYFGGL